MNLLHPVDADWQHELRHAITDPAQLLAELELPADLLIGAQEAGRLFALKVPRPYLNRIRKGDPNDPLLRQILPLGQELLEVPGFVNDPLAEAAANKSRGLIHKYTDRVLLILSGACAINCRYCFRRHFPYGDNQLGGDQWQAALEYIRNHEQVSEVIFSGGDPLATPDRRLARMISDLEAIPHLKRLRIHSRLPLVIPQRVTPELVNRLADSRLSSTLVLHINHPQEVDQQVRDSLKPLRQAGVTLLNQAVLLRGINDSVPVQKTLSENLFSEGILPYYLFVLDAVAGAAHFDISDEEARLLVGELQTVLPGYLVPRLAREIPGRPSKTLLLPIVPVDGAQI
ncbi:EF-P beta-lysylation protein EpmB [Marinobacterium sediminicola]|uniref:L-lysine 2,3-aminomutase n=1 Tax=Marinobacterium sediminicola TaxID=518898 RepID=A0ABY1S0H1_9GAMM|nr:EF-P beta-lysylation protein EpmB [Marinobacterium sediminicola]ULG69657.1 EF-P beta-lysylation protein EpmB [Marinobacterium sediminicola]SMR74615.1 L-lysine 2,3-aminomutase [Marinobacterium sediminicola]